MLVGDARVADRELWVKFLGYLVDIDGLPKLVAEYMAVELLQPLPVDAFKELDATTAQWHETPYSRLFALVLDITGQQGSPVTDYVVARCIEERVANATIRGEILGVLKVVSGARKRGATLGMDDYRYLHREILDRYRCTATKQVMLRTLRALNDGGGLAALDQMQAEVDEVRRATVGSGRQQSSNAGVGLGDLAGDRLRTYDAVVGSGGVTGVPTGFESFDRASGGVFPGELVVWSGRPQSGKTAFMLHSCFAAMQAHHNVVYFSRDSGYTNVLYRAEACFSGLPANAIRFGTLTEQQRRNYEFFLNSLRNQAGQFILYGREDCQTLVQMRMALRQVQRRYGSVGKIMYDYFQLGENAMGIRGASKIERLEMFCTGLKDLSSEFNATLEVGSQVTRASDLHSGIEGLSWGDALGNEAEFAFRITPVDQVTRRVRLMKARERCNTFDFDTNCEFSRMQVVEVRRALP